MNSMALSPDVVTLLVGHPRSYFGEFSFLHRSLARTDHRFPWSVTEGPRPRKIS
jgi:hypothetical protein